MNSLISAFVDYASQLPLIPHAFSASTPGDAEYYAWSSYRAAVSRWNDHVAIGSKVDSSKDRLESCLAGQML